MKRTKKREKKPSGDKKRATILGVLGAKAKGIFDRGRKSSRKVTREGAITEENKEEDAKEFKNLNTSSTLPLE